ncbi:MAG: GspE/PulE family protein, partial [Candidatus Nanopelagicaceae bacterium]
MTQASTIIPQSLAEAIPAIGLRFEKKSLLVGLPENFSNKEIDNALEQLVSNLNITVEALPVDPEIIRQSIEIAYSEVNSTDVNQINSSKFRIEERVIDIVNSIFENAVRLRSSDVHIEPLENELLVRVRVDGKLENLAALPISLAPAILSRLKVLAKVSIVERRRPQDGQFALEIMGRTMDVRLSTVATLYGEKAALRLLDTHRNLVDLTGLGMPENRLAQLQRMLKAGHGLVISAGPTGSGKTTTMHSALQIVN